LWARTIENASSRRTRKSYLTPCPISSESECNFLGGGVWKY
jgi:hypothetical protein